MVVGAINVDFVVIAPRLPGPGETVVGDGMTVHGGGKGANAAVAAARSGAAVSLVGAVGTDSTGRDALAELRADGVDVTYVEERADRPSGVALIVVDEAGENLIAVGAGANAAVAADAVAEALGDLLPVAGCVLVSTEIPILAVVAAVRAARAAEVLCVLNPAPVVPGLAAALESGPILTPNRGELADLVAAVGGVDGDVVPGDGVEASARVLADHTGSPVVVTLGAEGVLAIDGDVVERIPAWPVEAVDTTGAGDTFNGVLAAGLAGGLPLIDAARRAVVAAALSVSWPGARGGMPTATALDAAVLEAGA